jgi:hypothetical protein
VTEGGEKIYIKCVNPENPDEYSIYKISVELDAYKGEGLNHIFLETTTGYRSNKMTDGNIKKHLEVIKQFILQSDKNIDETDLWQSFLQIVEYIEATEKANIGCRLQAKPARIK